MTSSRGCACCYHPPRRPRRPQAEAQAPCHACAPSAPHSPRALVGTSCSARPSGIFIVTLHAHLCSRRARLCARGHGREGAQFLIPIAHTRKRSQEDTQLARGVHPWAAEAQSCPVSRGHRPATLAATQKPQPGPERRPPGSRRSRWMTGPENEVQVENGQARGLPCLLASGAAPPPHPAPPRCPLSSADTPTRLPEKIAC